jgi:ATP-dependent RNA helicase DDX23/PRP28
MLKRKKASEEAASKPKFLSKEERARLAIERRQREVAAKRAEQTAQLGVLRNRYGVNGDSNGVSDRRETTPNGTSRRSLGEDHRMNGSDSHKRSADDGEDSEMASMRARYMGLASEKIKKRRLNDRKFVFDWSTDTDTSVLAKTDVQPINVGFGRGHMGGFESKNSRRGELDKHWRDKALSEMTERDWRIFREDFNIATKGLLECSREMLMVA